MTIIPHHKKEKHFVTAVYFYWLCHVRQIYVFVMGFVTSSLPCYVQVHGWNAVCQLCGKTSLFFLCLRFQSFQSSGRSWSFPNRNSQLVIPRFVNLFSSAQFCGTVFVCPQSPYRENDITFWVLPIIHRRAFCMWYWPIRKHLDLSFICGHYHAHLVDDRSTSWLLYILLLHRPDETQPGRRAKQLSMVAILGF